MFIVDLDALEKIHLLDLVNQVLLEFLLAQNVQDVVGVGGTVHKRLSCPHTVFLVHADMFPPGDQVLFGLAHVRPHLDAPLALDVPAKVNHTIDLADGGLFLGDPGLEKFRNTGQTTGDILCLGGFDGDLGNNITRFYIIPFGDHDDGVRRHKVTCSGLGAGHFEGTVLSILDGYPGLELRTLIFGDDLGGDTGDLINLFLHGQAILNVSKLDLAVHLSEDGHTEGIPFGQEHPLLDLGAIGNLEPCTVDDRVFLFLPAILINDGDLTVAVHDNDITQAVLKCVEIDKAKETVNGSFQ